MPMTCSILGCSSRHSKGGNIKFFHFPFKDESRLTAWINAINRQNWTPSKYDTICNEHFTANDYFYGPGVQKTYLKPTAIPSIFPTSNLKFPKNEDLKLKWSKAIGTKVYRSTHICSKHFNAEDYKNYDDLNLIRKILKPSAVPSIHIKLSEKLGPIENSLSGTTDISTENKNDERLQVDGLSMSKSIDNPTSKRTLDNEMLCSTANQAKQRKIKNDTLTALKKQRYQNGILGIVRREDFKDENAWLRFQKYINKIKKQYKILSHKNQKLHHEINNFKELLTKQLSDDVLEM